MSKFRREGSKLGDRFVFGKPHLEFRSGYDYERIVARLFLDIRYSMGLPGKELASRDNLGG
jgi:hypothetical protein